MSSSSSLTVECNEIHKQNLMYMNRDFCYYSFEFIIFAFSIYLCRYFYFRFDIAQLNNKYLPNVIILTMYLFVGTEHVYIFVPRTFSPVAQGKHTPNKHIISPFYYDYFYHILSYFIRCDHILLDIFHFNIFKM